MLRSKEDKIGDYLKAAPEDVPRRDIEAMYKQYNGDEAKIHEAINAMWESNPLAQGEWESVKTKREKKKEKSRTQSQANGRGGHGRNSRNRRDGQPQRGQQKGDRGGRRPVNKSGQRQQAGNQTSRNNSRNGSQSRGKAAPASSQPAPTSAPTLVKAPPKKVQENIKTIPVAVSSTSSAGNSWSKGPPDFARMELMREQEKQRQQQLLLDQQRKSQAKKQQKPDSKDPTPSQAFSGNTTTEEKDAGSSIKPEEPKVVIPEKPKVPSWADKVSAKPQSKPTPPPQPTTAAPPKKPVITKRKQVEKKEVEAAPPAADESATPAQISEDKGKSVPIKTADLSKAPVAPTKSIEVEEQTQKPVSKPMPVKKVVEKGVKLPTNFGSSTTDFSFGASVKKTPPNAWGKNTPASVSSSASSKVDDVNKSSLESSQKKFMSDLMQSSSNKEEEASSSKLTPASVVQQSLNEGNAVNVADFESKMIAAVDASAKENLGHSAVQSKTAQKSVPVSSKPVENPAAVSQPVVQQQRVPAQPNPSSVVTSQPPQQQNAQQNTVSQKPQQQQQPLGMPGNNQQHQRQFHQPKNNNRPKGSRGRVNKPFNNAQRPNQSQGQQQQGQFGQFPGEQNQMYQQGSDPNAPFNYPYNQQMTDMYGSSGYGYQNDQQYGNDPIYNQQSQQQAPQGQAKNPQELTGTTPPPGLGGSAIGENRGDQGKQQPQPQVQPPQQMHQHGGMASQHNQSGHQGNQQHVQQQPYGMNPSQSGPGLGQYGQGGYNAAPPGINPMQYQAGMPPYFPNYAANFYGYPAQSYGGNGSYAPPSRGYTGGFGGQPGMFDQSNMYGGYDNSMPGSSGMPNSTGGDSSAHAAGSQHSNMQSSSLGSKPGNTGSVMSHSQGQSQGPPGYGQMQNQQFGYGGQQYGAQQQNYFLQQPPMGFQQGYGAGGPSNLQQPQQQGQNHSQQHPNRQGHNQMQQQQQPPNTYGGWNQSR